MLSPVVKTDYLVGHKLQDRAARFVVDDTSQGGKVEESLPRFIACICSHILPV
jgi:hypothetical protein